MIITVAYGLKARAQLPNGLFMILMIHFSTIKILNDFQEKQQLENFQKTPSLAMREKILYNH